MDAEEERTGILAGDLGALVASGHAADVTIIADGVVWLPAHRAVLTARSPVFAAMFRQEVLEATGGSINIKDINHEVLGQLLQFMYTDEAPLLEVVAAELLAAADRYCVPVLKRKCEEQVIVELSVENAAHSAVLAFVHMCPRLKVAAINFIGAHKEVMATDGWKTALRQHTEVCVEICRYLGDPVALEAECQNGEPAATEDSKGGCLACDLLALLASGEGSDVTLKVGGASLPAHRSVLAARSSVLSERLKDATGGVLQVEGVKEEELRHALRYMYSDQLPAPENATERLLALADDYGLRLLKEYCEQQLADDISVTNAVSVAVVATKYSCTSLKKACINFIGNNIFEVMNTIGWDAAIHDDPDIMVDISKMVAAAQRDQWESNAEESSED